MANQDCLLLKYLAAFVPAERYFGVNAVSCPIELVGHVNQDERAQLSFGAFFRLDTSASRVLGERPRERRSPGRRMRSRLKIDVNKASKFWTAFNSVGWFDEKFVRSPEV